MDSKSKADLKKALTWIKQGKTQKAQRLLTKMLRRQARNAPAWFLLSYTLDNPKQQQYALEQAMRADPEYVRAKQRLEKLQGRSVEETASAPAFFPVEEPEPPLPAADGFLDATPGAPAEPLLPRSEEPAERPRRKILTLALVGLLLFVAVILGLAAMRIYSTQVSAPPPSATAASSATLPATITPTLALTGTPSPTATAGFRPPLVDAETLAQMETIQGQVSAVRGLQVNAEVANSMLPENTAAIVLANAYSDAEKEEQGEAQEELLKAFGLLAGRDSLRDYELNRQVDPLGGFYIPAQNTIYLVGDSFSGPLTYAYSRLFARALLTQSYPFLRVLDADCTVFTDACRAWAALAAGDAGLTAAQWLQANPDEQLLQELENLAPDPALMQSQEPAEFVRRELDFPGGRGLGFVQSLFDLGGWAQVDEAYAAPPVSSEQVLHTEKYLAGEGPLDLSDVSFRAGLGSAWEPLGYGSLGEWLTYLVLTSNTRAEARLPEETASAAAAGWGGDLFQAYLRESDGAVALAAHWVMDSAEDARELGAALAEHLALRFAQAANPLRTGQCWVGEGRRACLFVDGAEALWLLGPDEIVVIQVMLAHYPQFQ